MVKWGPKHEMTGWLIWFFIPLTAVILSLFLPIGKNHPVLTCITVGIFVSVSLWYLIKRIQK